MELTDIELALRWWNRKSIQERIELAKQAKFQIENRDFKILTMFYNVGGMVSC